MMRSTSFLDWLNNLFLPIYLSRPRNECDIRRESHPVVF